MRWAEPSDRRDGPPDGDGPRRTSSAPGVSTSRGPSTGEGPGRRAGRFRPPHRPAPGLRRRHHLECPHATAGGHSDLQRVGEHRADARSDPTSACPRPACWWSTTAAPTGRPTWSRRWRPSCPTSTCWRAAAKSGLGQRLPGRLRLGPRARLRRLRRDRRRLLARPGGAALAGGTRSSEGFDVVIGSRYVEGGSIPNWAWHRHLLSRGGNLYASAVLGLGVADSTAGYRAYSAAHPARASTSTASGPRATASRSR